MPLALKITPKRKRSKFALDGTFIKKRSHSSASSTCTTATNKTTTTVATGVKRKEPPTEDLATHSKRQNKTNVNVVPDDADSDTSTISSSGATDNDDEDDSSQAALNTHIPPPTSSKPAHLDNQNGVIGSPIPHKAAPHAPTASSACLQIVDKTTPDIQPAAVSDAAHQPSIVPTHTNHLSNNNNNSMLMMGSPAGHELERERSVRALTASSTAAGAAASAANEAARAATAAAEAATRAAQAATEAGHAVDSALSQYNTPVQSPAHTPEQRSSDDVTVVSETSTSASTESVVSMAKSLAAIPARNLFAATAHNSKSPLLRYTFMLCEGGTAVLWFICLCSLVSVLVAQFM